MRTPQQIKNFISAMFLGKCKNSDLNPYDTWISIVISHSKYFSTGVNSHSKEIISPVEVSIDK